MVSTHERAAAHSAKTRTARLFDVDDVPDIVFLVDRSTLAIVDMNRSAGAFGHPREALLDMAIPELVAGATPELFARAHQGTHDPHPDVPLRVTLETASGDTLPVDVRVVDAPAQPGAYLCAFRPLSENARVAEREIVSVVCAVPTAIVTFKKTGEIVTWNPAAERLFGWTTKEMLGKSIELVLPASDRDDFFALSRKVFSGDRGMARSALRHRRDDDGSRSEIEVEECLFLIRDVAWQPVRLGATFRDASDVAVLRRRAEALEGSKALAMSFPRASAAMAAVEEAASKAAADPRATILLLGETGVGKSHLARQIHTASPRKDRPFLEINCAGLDEKLAESELFGHERGAFTGALTQKRGLVEVADGGTLLLDEVAELPLPVQAKLLTFLDDGAFRRVGGLRRLEASVRIVAATNVDLDEAVKSGRFRKDLYYRLSVFPIVLPPLRMRSEEIPPLVTVMLQELARRRGTAAPDVTPAALRALQIAAWPGNFRELKNTLERAFILSGGKTISSEHLPLDIRPGAQLASSTDKLDDMVRAHIERILAEENGNRSRAADRLGIDRATLRRRLSADGDVRDT
jgi:PAS domain S-box-containing protein